MRPNRRRRICFVTGTRAEFGLMQPVLAAIDRHRKLDLQIVATGMHLDRAHGDGLAAIRAAGYAVDATIAWPTAKSPVEVAAATGTGIALMARVFEKLDTDVVLVVGDRVEAFAAASAAAISGPIVAHVHGGDRALGQVDDSLRHAITKLAHLHFPATTQSAKRIVRMGEDAWRVHLAGSPGVDGIVAAATASKALAVRYRLASPFALLVLHPTSRDDTIEAKRARLLFDEVSKSGVQQVVIIGPNNDPGCRGILRAWEELAGDREDVCYRADVPRGDFLGLMRDAAFLVGNSSSGIIEAASFGTPVLDVGERQEGRERGGNVVHADFDEGSLRRGLKRVWLNRGGRKFPRQNVYGRGRAGQTIAGTLAGLADLSMLSRKLIAY